MGIPLPPSIPAKFIRKEWNGVRMAAGNVYGCAGFELVNALQSPFIPAFSGCIDIGMDNPQQVVLNKKGENFLDSVIKI